MLQYVRTKKKLTEKKDRQTNKLVPKQCTAAEVICTITLFYSGILPRSTASRNAILQKNVAINLDHRVTTEMSQTFAFD